MDVSGTVRERATWRELSAKIKGGPVAERQSTVITRSHGSDTFPGWQQGFFAGFSAGVPHTYKVDYNSSTGKITMQMGGVVKATTPWSPETAWHPGWEADFSGETHDRGDDMPGTPSAIVLFDQLKEKNSHSGSYVDANITQQIHDQPTVYKWNNLPGTTDVDFQIWTESRAETVRVMRMTALAVGVFLVLTACSAMAGAPAGPDQATIDTLNEHGYEFVPLSPADAKAAAPKLDESQAVDVARSIMTPVDAPVTFLGRLTDRNAHVGDERSALSTQDRLSYAIQLTGLTIAPQGRVQPSEAPIPESALHHELWVFVDANTGEWRGAINFR